MEYVPGKNALEWVGRSSDPLPIARGADRGSACSAASHYAHGKGYVHRDVKPSNLLIDGPVPRPESEAVGLRPGQELPRERRSCSDLTRQGDVGGSVGFISPDHIRDFRDVKEPADIYCAGATLYLPA